MVNPERSWSGVIIKCSERGGEIVAAPLRSHTLESIPILQENHGLGNTDSVHPTLFKS